MDIRAVEEVEQINNLISQMTSARNILIALRYWGRNQMQDDAADIHGLTQQSFSTVCHRVARARLEYIKMPKSLNDQLKHIELFEAIADFKNVVGAIDCTHIRRSKVQGPSG
ncbi:unnamed protein product [Pieris macdunnoughi]|uniref:Nuclease HARBI1 n=1 Tax=Pieris macdunnoughi TaxID=345717 RepID=A0A821VY25_9NEOP|nr:unnamed protein product [Pieris macdunnoughi]CAF4930966.1 unnamed protein product [Pieris macdunnoughi]CAF4942171.1 unnamed protein product [Pieris macdunnoughi]